MGKTADEFLLELGFVCFYFLFLILLALGIAIERRSKVVLEAIKYR